MIVMYVCICNAVSDKAIDAAVEQGIATFEALQVELGVGTTCGCCADFACAHFAQRLAQHQAAQSPVQAQPADLSLAPSYNRLVSTAIL